MLLSAIDTLIILSRLLNKTYILLRAVLHMLWSPYLNTKLLVRRQRRKRIETEEKKLRHAEIDGQRVGNNIQGRKKKKGKRVWEADVGTDETWKGSRKRVKEEEMVSNDGASLQRSHTERQLWLNTNKTHTHTMSDCAQILVFYWCSIKSSWWMTWPVKTCLPLCPLFY